MGSKGSQTTTTNQTQTYAPNPAIAASGTQALTAAQQAAQAPFQQPVAPVAPFNPFQQLGFGETLGAQGMAQPYFGLGSAYLQGSAAPVSGQDVANYYNPMAANVFGQMQNIFGQQMRETTGQATQQAGGVGADRIGVAQANLANQQGLAAGQTASQLYQQALQAAEQQKQMMAGAGYGLGQMGPAAQAAQLQGIQALLGAGGQQQQLTQAQLNALYQNRLAQIAYPFQTAQYLAGITGGLAPAMGGTTTGQATTTQPSPSMLAQILGIGTAGAGLYGAMGGGNPFAGGLNPSVPGATSVVGGAGSLAVPTFFQGGGGVSDYGKLADKAYRKELGDILPAAEAGNPLAEEVYGDIGGSLPMQTGGGVGIKDFLSPVITGDWKGPFSTIGALEGKGPFSTQGLINLLQSKQQQPSSQGQSDQSGPSGAVSGSGIGSGLINMLHSMGFQSGGDVGQPDQPLPFPGASVPKIGGPSPVPFIQLQPGAGRSGPYGQFMPMQHIGGSGGQQSSGGSGSGIGQAVSMAMQFLPMLMAARGGGVSPFDVGQSFQDGGDIVGLDDYITTLPDKAVPPPPPAPQRETVGSAPADVPMPPPRPSPMAAVTPPPTNIPMHPAAVSRGPAASPFQGLTQAAMPSDANLDWGQRMARSPWMALVAAGAKMAQTRGPIGSVIGAGLESGAGELEAQRKDLRSDADISLKAQRLEEMAAMHLSRIQAAESRLGVSQARLELERERKEMGKAPDLNAIYARLSNDITWQAREAASPGTIQTRAIKEYNDLLNAQRQIRSGAPAAAAAPAELGSQSNPIPYTRGMKTDKNKFYRADDGSIRPGTG